MVFNQKPTDADSAKFGSSERFGRGLNALNIAVAFATSLVAWAPFARAQVNYVARFTLEKSVYRVGEPVFCTFEIRNTGTPPFAFSYRSPWRALGSRLPKEPQFQVTDAKGRRLPDPAPKPCGGAREGVVYGFVSLPPGGTHRERWLLNQWAKLSAPGHYSVHAERRLPLVGINPSTEQLSKEPLAFALAVNELSFELMPATEDELRPLLDPYLRALDDPKAGELSGSVLVASTLPRTYFLDRLVRLANPQPSEQRWDRRRGLEGLARLGTPPAWAAILDVARGSGAKERENTDDLALRGYAILLLGERGDPAFVGPLVAMLPSAPQEIRGDILRTLGFFHSPRANQALFERLHSTVTTDRVNSILGLRNLESKNAVPALMAMVTDPEPEVRQVANFALQNLTGVRIPLEGAAGKAEAETVSAHWHAWWREHNSSFTPPRPAPCRDW